MLLGIIAATIGGIFGTESTILHWVVALVCFAIGLHLLGAFKFSFDFLARLQPKRVASRGSSVPSSSASSSASPAPSAAPPCS